MNEPYDKLDLVCDLEGLEEDVTSMLESIEMESEFPWDPKDDRNWKGMLQAIVNIKQYLKIPLNKDSENYESMRLILCTCGEWEMFPYEQSRSDCQLFTLTEHRGNEAYYECPSCHMQVLSKYELTRKEK